MYDDHQVDGVVYTDGNVCTWYTLKNKQLKKLASENIFLQNQFKKGGQSTNRLARNRDIQRDHYITQLVERSVDLFYDKCVNRQTVLNVLFCGPAEFKTEMAEHKLVLNFFSNVHVLTMGNMDVEILNKYVDELDDPSEMIHLEEILTMIRKADDRIVFGEDVVLNLTDKKLGTLYLHVDIDCENFMGANITSLCTYNIKIVKLKSQKIMEYGGVIGVRFY